MYFWIQNFLDSKKVLQGIYHILDNTGVWRRSLLSEKFKLNIINDGYKCLMSVSVTNYLKTNKPKKKKKKNILVIRSFRASEQTSWFELKGIGP